MGAIFPYMAESIGGSVFFIFGALIILSCIYIQIFVPETKDKTISEVNESFKRQKQR